MEMDTSAGSTAINIPGEPVSWALYDFADESNTDSWKCTDREN